MADSDYEVSGVETTSVAYRSGIRNGDALRGYNYFDEDGRTKPHDWHDEALDELKQCGLVFVLVWKNEPLKEAERLHWVRREKYVSQIKSKLGDSIELDQFLERVQSWDSKRPAPAPDVADGQHTSGFATTVRDSKTATTSHCESGGSTGNILGPNVETEVEKDTVGAKSGPETDAQSSVDDNAEASGAHTVRNTQLYEQSSGEVESHQLLSRFTIPRCRFESAAGCGNTNSTNSGDIEDEDRDIDRATTRVRGHAGIAGQPSYAVQVATASLVFQERIFRHHGKNKVSDDFTKKNVGGVSNDEQADGFTSKEPHEYVGIAKQFAGSYSSSKRASSSPNILSPSLQKRPKITNGKELAATNYRAGGQFKQEAAPQLQTSDKPISTLWQYEDKKNPSSSTVPSTTMPVVIAPVSSSLGTQQQTTLAVNEEETANVAARKFLLAVARKPILKRLSKFPCWEKRLLEVLGKQVEKETTMQLGMTMTILRDATSKRELSNVLLDEYVDWIIQTVKCLPDVESGHGNMDLDEVSLSEHINDIKKKLAVADSTGATVKATTTWVAVLDSIVLAITHYVERASKLRTSVVKWCERANDHLHNHQGEIMEREHRWRQQLNRHKLACESAEQRMEELQQALDNELQRTEESFSREHRKLAELKDFAGCSRRRNSYQKQLASDPQVVSLRNKLAQCYTDLRTNNKAVAAARDTLAFWEGILKLCKTVQDQIDERSEIPFSSIQDDSHEDLQWIGLTLINALENYFNQSFQVQKDALVCMEKMREIQAEHYARFAGYISFETTGVTQYQKILDQSRQEDNKVVKNLALLWKEHTPEVGHRFGHRELDAKLTNKHQQLWNGIKQALQEVWSRQLVFTYTESSLLTTEYVFQAIDISIAHVPKGVEKSPIKSISANRPYNQDEVAEKPITIENHERRERCENHHASKAYFPGGNSLADGPTAPQSNTSTPTGVMLKSDADTSCLVM
ncbi:unnamed protein product [Phytophthora fragariaefolia]|uniref:Unnamed protein product n=1 Tax=Phytophthora fragariaefolia TaxID=1490495 RepID=A0A9W6XQK1_9STRA|nr:unnamed protein product [Phytophthora fragariaefolia]